MVDHTGTNVLGDPFLPEGVSCPNKDPVKPHLSLG